MRKEIDEALKQVDKLLDEVTNNQFTRTRLLASSFEANLKPFIFDDGKEKIYLFTSPKYVRNIH